MDVVDEAFRLADEYFPTTELFVNDDNTSARTSARGPCRRTSGHDCPDSRGEGQGCRDTPGASTGVGVANVAEETGVDLRLADVLQALTAELGRATDGSTDVRVDTVTVELDVSVAADADGGVSFRVGKGSGATKRGKTTRLSVTLSSPTGAETADGAPLPAQVEGAVSPSEPDDAVAAPSSSPEPRPLGLVDVLADALRTIADTAGRSGTTGWPPRPGDSRPGDSRPRGDRPGGGHPGLID